MYEDFLRGLLTYLEALNKACQSVDESKGTIPYLDLVPVVLEGELCGFLTDEIGGEFCYEAATPAQQEWWKAFPKA